MCNSRKCTFVHVLPAKIQITLHIWAVWSVSLLGTFWTAKDEKFLCVDNGDWSDCMAVQANLSLCWVHLSEGMFSHVAAICFAI